MGEGREREGEGAAENKKQGEQDRLGVGREGGEEETNVTKVLESAFVSL
jgi:hypothetical protein